MGIRPEGSQRTRICGRIERAQRGMNMLPQSRNPQILTSIQVHEKAEAALADVEWDEASDSEEIEVL